MIRIDDHTFDERIVVDGNGWVIDAGCRGFRLERTLTELVIGQPCYALDIDNFSDNEVFGDTVFKHAALSHQRGTTEAYYFGNGTANFLKGINDVPSNTPERPCETRTVEMITLGDIYAEIGTEIDLLKLDVEGAEYEILLNMEPIPKQITVEFHEHCHGALHNKYIDAVIEKMRKDYHIHLFHIEPRYHYLDCLFIRKDIA